VDKMLPINLCGIITTKKDYCNRNAEVIMFS
jgi:hypothetical protein